MTPEQIRQVTIGRSDAWRRANVAKTGTVPRWLPIAAVQREKARSFWVGFCVGVMIGSGTVGLGAVALSIWWMP